MKKLKILQLDGGGLLGTMFLVFLVTLEKIKRKSIYDMFDMFVGTSTGAIAGAMFAAEYSADEVLQFYVKNAKKIFNKKWFWVFRGGKYDREYIDKKVKGLLPMKMKDLKKDFICTGIDMNQKFQPTHFFKSYKDKYKNFLVSELVGRSYSAPTYFEPKEYKKQLWIDGGTGVQNCTLIESYVETIRLKKKSYLILSCGCGMVPKRTNKSGLIAQLKVGISLARTQAVNEQISYANQLKINYYRVDTIINEKYDEMDNYKYMKKFQEYGTAMVKYHLKKVIVFLT